MFTLYNKNKTESEEFKFVVEVVEIEDLKPREKDDRESVESNVGKNMEEN